MTAAFILKQALVTVALFATAIARANPESNWTKYCSETQECGDFDIGWTEEANTSADTNIFTTAAGHTIEYWTPSFFDMSIECGSDSMDDIQTVIIPLHGAAGDGDVSSG